MGLAHFANWVQSYSY